MKRTAMKIATCAIMLLAACDLVSELTPAGLQPGSDQPGQTLPIAITTQGSACKSSALSEASSIQLTVVGHTLTIADDNATFNCCLIPVMQVTVEQNIITVLETETGDTPCYCMCQYELSAQVTNLPDGDYLVRVYHSQIDAASLVHEQTVAVPGGQPIIGAPYQSQCLASGEGDGPAEPVSCEAMDARGAGEACYLAMGWLWDGAGCSMITGFCECQGSDCDALFATQAECETAYAGCSGEQIEVTTGAGTLTVRDRGAEFNCCLAAWMEATVSGTRIVVVEVEDPDTSNACDCVCRYELSIEISNLPAGDYTVEVYRSAVDESTRLALRTATVDG
ncbi:MAG: hypothetical protein JXR83_15710 [Deltaproteobacteria bacterium]|nr:hypothetical protein [Deltaproteobacteria bacterium]